MVILREEMLWVMGFDKMKRPSNQVEMEMERDALLSHGSVGFLKERLFDMSDPFYVTVCPQCGMIVNRLDECKRCSESNLHSVNIPYACKLLIHELFAMNIKVKLKADS